MRKYLIDTIETYRVESEEDAAALINEAKRDASYLLEKYSSTRKEVKQKGEVIETYYKVTLSKKFNDIKEPYTQVEVSYDIDEEVNW